MKPEGGRREARGWRRAAANAFTAGTAEMGSFLHGGRLRGWEVSARLRGVCGRAEIIRPHFEGAGGWRRGRGEGCMKGYFPLVRQDGGFFAAECRERSRCEISPDLTLGAHVVLPWLQYSGAPLGSFTFELGLLKLKDGRDAT